MSTLVYAAESALLIAGLVWFVRPWIRARRLGAPLPLDRVFAWRIGGLPPDLIVDAYLAERAAGHEHRWNDLQDTWLTNRNRITNAAELARFARERQRPGALTRARS